MSFVACRNNMEMELTNLQATAALFLLVAAGFLLPPASCQGSCPACNCQFNNVQSLTTLIDQRIRAMLNSSNFPNVSGDPG